MSDMNGQLLFLSRRSSVMQTGHAHRWRLVDGTVFIRTAQVSVRRLGVVGQSRGVVGSGIMGYSWISLLV